MRYLLAASVGALTTAALFACVGASSTTGSTSAAELADEGGAVPARGGVVISQVYAGGGTPGAAIDHDFVELLNHSATAISLNGLSLQYANAEGDFGGAGDTSIVALSGTLKPGQYALVQLATGGAVGTPLIPSDLSGDIALDPGAGKFAIAPSTAALGCGGSAGARCATAKVLDVVGWGLVSDFEGQQPIVALTNAKAAIRAGKGCTDANDNRADFATGDPAPRNAGSPAVDPCSTAPGPKPAGEGGTSGPPPPVMDPPLGPESPDNDSGLRKDAGARASGGESDSCAVAATGADGAPGASLVLALLAFGGVMARRRLRRASA